MYPDSNAAEIERIMSEAWTAFHGYRRISLAKRSEFMKTIATDLRQEAERLVPVAVQETNLPAQRLRGELARTIFQLESYAEACEKGDWMDIRIDTADPNKTPAKPDIRKMLVPLGPVVVFGASNFPFAYSTAGGDTACAFAAGCPVIVKAHPAHSGTSTLVADIISTASSKCRLPRGTFAHVYGKSPEVGHALVTNTHTKAVGFTGSFAGGKQLFDWANQRKEPIPVFSEMGSTNPVFLLPDKLRQDYKSVAKLYAGSITLGVGQFCTNPGIIVGIAGESLNEFMSALGAEIRKAVPATMLHPGIANSFWEKRSAAIHQTEVEVLAESVTLPLQNQGQPTIASVSAAAFMNNPILHQEVFGPYSIIVRCESLNEMLEVVRTFDGQLTATIMGSEKDMMENDDLVESIKNICGRFILNGVPTGVEVCLSMHHGGPFPATTDARFTSVGADGIKRFARPIAYQNWNDSLLPEELKNANPCHIWRTINNELTRNSIN
ncbi:MAG TPA: aldehyde dehydrogenase (NADP(+)) [Puia sp.]|nr:aldehyde dehydrogenase (NADP(+)) [Puia sp.]